MTLTHNSKVIIINPFKTISFKLLEKPQSTTIPN